MIHRLLLALLGCLLALAAPASAHTTASRLPVVPTPVALFAVEFSDAQDCGPLTLHLDGLHHRAGPCRGVLVRQNPWTSFDPEGLSPAFMMHNPNAAWDPKIRAIVNSNEYKEGYKQGMARGFVAGAAMTVGVGVTVATGGWAGPFVAQAGLSATSSMLVTAAISGAAGGAASQITGNALTGQPLGEGVPEAAAKGALFNAGGAVVGRTIQAFGEGLREADAIAGATKLAQQAAANNAPGGAAGMMISYDGQVVTGLSNNAGGGAISPSVRTLFGSARTTCAEGRMLTEAERLGIDMRGGTSAVVAVGPRPPAGSPMAACEGACKPVLQAKGVGDAVAGTSGDLPRSAIPVPVVPDDKKTQRKE